MTNEEFLQLKEHRDYCYNILRCEQSLHTFIQAAWPLVEGGKPFDDNWHIGAVCEHLEAVANLEITRLIINQPPRTTKTNLTSIFFPAWLWIRNPGVQFLCLSNDYKLAHTSAINSRTVILSEWYQRRWNDRFQIRKDRNAVSDFANDKTGYRISRSFLSTLTGKSADIINIDDPNKTKESDTIRETVNQTYDRVISTRLNNPMTGCIVLTQQRTHEKDLTGHLLARDEAKKWVVLRLPMYYQKNRQCKTIILPSANGKVWQDPRTEDNELLWPQRLTKEYVEERRQELGSEYAFSGQYQQMPAPEEGGIIKKHWFKWWKQSAIPRIEQVISSWDTALTADDHKKSAYSACTTWGLFLDEDWIPNLIMLGAWRGRVEYPELREIAQKFYLDYRHTLSTTFKPSGQHVPDVVLVEGKANGFCLIQDFQKAGIMANKFNPDKYGDKIFRVKLITHLIQGGRIWMPAKGPDYARLIKWADEFVESCALFPQAESRDYVDTMTQVLLYLDSMGMLTSPKNFPNEQKVLKVYSKA